MNASTERFRVLAQLRSAVRAHHLVKAMVAVAILCPMIVLAQVPPRFYWQSLAGANAVPLIYQSLSGNANPMDPAHYVSPDVSGSVDANVAIVGYAKMLPLFDRTLTLAVLEPVGRISGDAIVRSGNDSTIVSQDANGFGDYFHIDNFNYELYQAPNPTPEPGMLLLLGAGLAGMAFSKRRNPV